MFNQRDLNNMHILHILVIVRDKKSAFDIFCCFVAGIWVSFWLTSYYRHGDNLVLLKFKIKRLEVV